MIEVTAHISTSSRRIEICFDDGSREPGDNQDQTLTINEATELRDELSKILKGVEGFTVTPNEKGTE